MGFIYCTFIILFAFFVNRRVIQRALAKSERAAQSVAFDAYMNSLREKSNSIIDKNEIDQLLHSASRLTKGNWNHLEIYINQSQDYFAAKLRQNYSSLTEDDIHIILLMRMGLDHKEISIFCNILLSSLRTRRSRLKKKMRVNCDSISEFIRELYKN
ncbi:hypothetical protein [Bacteroides sp.]|uniref:helix-turn-helix transcriptional regulator n=1 Tax=Bacteroides sp. TaxID=29523 RepID=UPI00262AF5CD|nr:hypothetical protein [Bacteroides sp.]MDD3038306.1 hypothetical protein [Bacteroides sp.]